MQVVHQRCAAIDVSEDVIAVAVRAWITGRPEHEGGEHESD
jgi:hypothetical protein